MVNGNQITKTNSSQAKKNAAKKEKPPAPAELSDKEGEEEVQESSEEEQAVPHQPTGINATPSLKCAAGDLCQLPHIPVDPSITVGLVIFLCTILIFVERHVTRMTLGTTSNTQVFVINV